MGKVTSEELVKSAYKKLIRSYRKQSALVFDNHIWIDQDLQVDQSFTDLLSDNFDTETSIIDLDRKKAVDEINDWISKITENNIQNVVEKFAKDTKLVLTNAAYFKNNWLVPFKTTNKRGKTSKG